jgi:hypothetical protein
MYKMKLWRLAVRYVNYSWLWRLNVKKTTWLHIKEDYSLRKYSCLSFRMWRWWWRHFAVNLVFLHKQQTLQYNMPVSVCMFRRPLPSPGCKQQFTWNVAKYVTFTVIKYMISWCFPQTCSYNILLYFMYIIETLLWKALWYIVFCYYKFIIF